MTEIVTKVVSTFEVSEESIIRTKRDGTNNVAHWVAMYLCRDAGDYRLHEIASYFGLRCTDSIPTTMGKLMKLIGQDEELRMLVDQLQ